MSNIPSHETWQIQDSTKINEFMSCPRAYFYKYVLGWREEVPSNHLVFGSSWHLAMEYVLLHGYETQSIMDAYDLLLADYRTTFGPDTDDIFHPKTPDNALIMLTKYCSQWKDDPQLYRVVVDSDGKPYTEIAGTIGIGADRFIYFRMDSVLERISDGKKKSREHKTGSNSYLWMEQWPLSFQVSTYNHALYCLYDYDEVLGVEMNGCMFRKVKKGWEQLRTGQPLTVQEPFEFVRGTIHKNKSQMQMWMDMANSYFEDIELEFDILDSAKDSDDTMYAFPLRPTSCVKYGRVCEFNDFCLSWPNPLQKCQLPPIGFIVDHWDPTQAEAKQTFNF